MDISAASSANGKDLEGLRLIRICRRAPSQVPQCGQQIKLDTVGSYNIDLDVGDRRGFSTYTLRGVPMFLYDAFKLLRQRGMDVEGIFRKEGNKNRLGNVWPIYFGCKDISDRCNTHDICSIIKRFFRELRTPLLDSLHDDLLQIASKYEGRERVEKLLLAVRELPPANLGTFSFLMRQLKYLGEHHEQGHLMTIENLALVFAPTLFRDDFPTGSNKKKKGSQESVISSVYSNHELKVKILVDLIDNAHKIGFPQDYYLASRGPSDLVDKSRYHKFTSSSSSRLMGVSPRSSSARPSSRQHAFVVNDDITKQSGDERRSSNKNDERSKLRPGRRSSSAVREIFTTISAKVFRRALSPGGGTRMRRSSDDLSAPNAVDMGDAIVVIPDEEKTPMAANTSPDGVSRVYVSDNGNVGSNEQQKSTLTTTASSINDVTPQRPNAITRVLSFGNMEAQSSVNAVSNDDADASVRIRPLAMHNSNMKTSSIASKQTSIDKKHDDDEGAAMVVQRRSRRESPRRHLTVNSRVKPVSPMRHVNPNWLNAASPADEPNEMDAKHIQATNDHRKESDDKSRNVTSGKIVKRNSSSKNTKRNSSSSQKVPSEQSDSLLEGYGNSSSSNHRGRNNGDRRRWHTTPIRPNAVLRRNQPNTLATGLKATQVQVRGRRSTTSFGSTMEDNTNNNNVKGGDKKKRGSSIIGLSCNDAVPHDRSDEENDNNSFLNSITAEANDLMQQKSIECRERRAKRHKRREVNAQTNKKGNEKTSDGNLLDDVTNELERLERVRGNVATTSATTSLSSLTALANDHRDTTSSTKLPLKVIAASEYNSSSSRVTKVTTANEHGKPITVSCHSTLSCSITKTSSPTCDATTPISSTQTLSSSSMVTESQKLKRQSSADNRKRSPLKKNSSSSKNNADKVAVTTHHHKAATDAEIDSAISSVPSSAATTTESVPSVRRAKTCGMPYKTKCPSMDAESMRLYRRGQLNMAQQQYSLDESEFALSGDIKRQIVSAHTAKDIKDGPACIDTVARPSVAHLLSENRGFVRQRIHQFAQLGYTNPYDDIIYKGSSFLNMPLNESEFVKPVAPPAAHTIQQVNQQRGALSPGPRNVNVSARTKHFEALAKAAASSMAGNIRKAAQKKAVTSLNVAAKLSRRVIGERREARITRQLLSKSLGKLELIALSQLNNTKSCSGRLMTLDDCLANLDQSVNLIQNTSQQQQQQQQCSAGTYKKETKLNRKRLKYVNPMLSSRTTNLHALPQTELSI